jgi:hypothetical protein
MKAKEKDKGKTLYKRRGPNSSIILLTGCRHGEYDEVIAAAFAGAGRFGSAANALATFARESPTFRQILGELQQSSLNGKKGKRSK